MSEEKSKEPMSLANVKISNEQSVKDNHVMLNILNGESEESIFNLLKLPELDSKNDKGYIK